MKCLLWTVAVGALGAFIAAGGPADAQISQNGPYYATPSWDQKLPASTRFIVLTDWNSAAVLDRETGLVWERAPGGPGNPFISPVPWVGPAGIFPLKNALGFCRAAHIGDRFGWRLPTEEELSTLVDPTINTEPNLPPGNPFQGVSTLNGDIFWTASQFESDDTLAYAVSFDPQGIPPVLFPKTDSFRTWCVRGGSTVSNSPY